MQRVSIRKYMATLTKLARQQTGNAATTWVPALQGQPNTTPAMDQALHAMHETIPMHWKRLPALERISNDGAKPGWAFRGETGAGEASQPSSQLLQQDPGYYLCRLLDRCAMLFVHPKWRGCGVVADMSLFANSWLVLASNPASPYPMGVTTGALGVCLPVSIPSSLPRRRGPMHTRHFCATQAPGYIRVYLGLEAAGEPIYELLHRLLNLAFNGPPGPNQESSHTCGNAWCCNVHHLVWESHADNVRRRWA